MTAITVKATFDGSSFTIHDSINLEPNVDYILTIEKEERMEVESPVEILRDFAQESPLIYLWDELSR